MGACSLVIMDSLSVCTCNINTFCHVILQNMIMNTAAHASRAATYAHNGKQLHSLYNNNIVIQRNRSWYLSNKRTARHKLPVTCFIGVCLSVEDCLCNCVLCAPKSPADEWEFVTGVRRQCDLLDASVYVLQAGYGLRGKVKVLSIISADSIRCQDFFCSVTVKQKMELFCCFFLWG